MEGGLDRQVIDLVVELVFTFVSLIAGTLNFVFIRRSQSRNQALLQLRSPDPDLKRISRGFIYVWGCVVFNDVVRIAVGAGILLGHPSALFLLVLSPFGSLLVAVIGLRSFR